ncbi:MAG TPA: hypothetical protein HPP81_04190 [Deltaproteobacteria bacterium]|jgi:hypothetical protein|nr:hypothetical protein [Deltaproteobacteria bacterium]
MQWNEKRIPHTLIVAAAAMVVYMIAHWQGFRSPFVINDDVRQQIFWMQQWLEPNLYPNDLLAGYARDYVSWGVIAIYRVASVFMDPLQFTKVLTGILFVLSALLIYCLCLELRDDFAALLGVCIYFLFGLFLGEMSGGLPRAFAFPLLIGYLCLLARKRLLLAAITVLVQSIFVPYIFLLCLTTHLFYVAHLIGRSLVRREAGDSKMPIARIAIQFIPLTIGACLMMLKYVVFKSPRFGGLVGMQEIAGKIEYTAVGRYEVLRPLHRELIEHWSFILPFHEWGPIAGWCSVAAVAGLAVFALSRPRKNIHPGAFRVFVYLMAASFILYVLSCSIPLKLFIPGRYLEYSLTVFYCISLAACLKIVIDHLKLKRIVFPWLFLFLTLLGAVRLHNVELFDYSAYSPLYRFFDSTPVDTVIAGHPEVMDSVMTFSRRKAFVTYKLSHAWIEPYWSVIKQRTYDLFNAYYSNNAEQIRNFCKRNGIGYIVVREEDFSEQRLRAGKVYFQPFGSYIAEITRSRAGFAILNTDLFPPVFRMEGVRVVRID